MQLAHALVRLNRLKLDKYPKQYDVTRATTAPTLEITAIIDNCFVVVDPNDIRRNPNKIRKI